MQKKIFTGTTLFAAAIFILTVCCGPSYGRELDKFKLSAGVKGYASSGISETSLYYRPYVETGYSGELFSVMPSLSQFRDYQVTDGSGNYELINFFEAGCALSLYPWDFLGIDMEYFYSSGDMEYLSSDMKGGIVLDFRKTAFTVQYSRRNSQYSFNGADITAERNVLFFELNYYMKENRSIDLSFDRRSDIYDSLDYDYSQNTIRAGMSFVSDRSVIVLGGIFAGMDSADYAIAGADMGVSVRIKGHVKITLTGRISHYAAPLSVKSSGSGGSSGSKTNPFLQTSSVGESYTEKSASLGAAWIL